MRARTALRALPLVILASTSVGGGVAAAAPPPGGNLPPPCMNTQIVSTQFQNPIPEVSTTIAGALAKICAGGTVFVTPGTYEEVLTVNKNVTIKGSSVNTKPLITNIQNDGSTLPQPVFTIVGKHTVTFDNVVIAPVGVYGVFGQGSEVGASNVTVKNTAVSGGTNGIYGMFHKLTVSSSAFDDASINCVQAFSDGRPGSRASFNASTATACGSSSFSSLNFELATFTHNTVSGGAAAGGGGLVSIFDDQVQMSENQVELKAVGIWIFGDGGGSIHNNVTRYSGFSDVLVQNSSSLSFATNISIGSHERGISVYGSHALSFSNNFIHGATGPGLFVYNSDGISTHDNFVHMCRRGMYFQNSSDVLLVGDTMLNCTRNGLQLEEVEGMDAFSLKIKGIQVDPGTPDPLSALDPDPVVGDVAVGAWGDGIDINHTGATGAQFNFVDIRNVARAGVAAYNNGIPDHQPTEVILFQVTVACALILFDQESDPGLVTHYNPDATTCLACDNSPLTCKAVSEHLTAPEPLTPIEPSQP